MKTEESCSLATHLWLEPTLYHPTRLWPTPHHLTPLELTLIHSIHPTLRKFACKWFILCVLSTSLCWFRDFIQKGYNYINIFMPPLIYWYTRGNIVFVVFCLSDWHSSVQMISWPNNWLAKNKIINHTKIKIFNLP